MENVSASKGVKIEAEESTPFDVSGYLLDAKFDLEEIEGDLSSFIIAPKVEIEEDTLPDNNEQDTSNTGRRFIDEYILGDRISIEENVKFGIKKDPFEIHQQESLNSVPLHGLHHVKKEKPDICFSAKQQPVSGNADVLHEIHTEINTKRTRKPTKPKILYYEIKTKRKELPGSKKEKKKSLMENESLSTTLPDNINDCEEHKTRKDTLFGRGKNFKLLSNCINFLNENTRYKPKKKIKRRKNSKAINSDQTLREVCKVCFRTFLKPHNLKRHMVTHAEVHYECNECGFKTKHECNLRRHELLHKGGNKQHKCKYCPYKSDQSGALLRHVRCRHSKERPFKCGDCKYKCGRRDMLISHIKTKHLQ